MPSPLPDSAPLVGFSGGGFYVAWMLGVAHELQQSGVPLDRCVVSGASAGAGVAAMLACGVDCAQALEWFLASPAAREAFERPLRCVGRCAGLATGMLERFLPADAARRCSGRVHILLHDIERGHRFCSEFASREQLVRAVMASAHVPLLSDGRLLCQFEGRPHVDGAWLSSRDAVLACRPRSALRVLVDYREDDGMRDQLHWWMLPGDPDVWRTRFRVGRNYAFKLRGLGQLPLDPRLHVSGNQFGVDGARAHALYSTDEG